MPKPLPIGSYQIPDAESAGAVEDLKTSKSLYVTKLNNADEPDPEPKQCKGLKDVFETYQPDVEVNLETLEGSAEQAEYKLRSLKDFESNSFVQKNEYLAQTYYEKEMMRDLRVQLGKNAKLKKTLADDEKRGELLKLLDVCLQQLS